MVKKKPLTKKEEYQQRHRDISRRHAIKTHKEEAKKLYVSKGGTPQEASKDGLQEDWRTKVKDMRGSIKISRSRSKKRGRAVFR